MFSKRKFSLVLLLVLTTILLGTSAVGAQDPPHLDWPDLYDPFQLLTLHLEMDPGDWNTIVGDTTFDKEFPAQFWAEGDVGQEPILISVRRKSADPIEQKVSLKLDLNEYKNDPGGASEWHGVKKLSLENGDDINPVTEGMAWYLHRLASGPEGYGYQPGLAAWVKLYVNGDYLGVYVNVEQPDKAFLNNHDFWQGGDETWLYKYSDIDSPEIKEGPEDEAGNPIDSPTFGALCYSPFQGKNATCDTPNEGPLATELPGYVNMQGLLTLGAVNAFAYAPDALFSKGKNYYFIDTLNGPTRKYIPWDLDSAFVTKKVTASIYDRGQGQGTDFEKYIIDNPTFHAQYNRIMCALITGPMDPDDVVPDVDAFELLLTDALAADPNNNLEGEPIDDFFDTIRQFLLDRDVNVHGQLAQEPALTPDHPAVTITALNSTDLQLSWQKVLLDACGNDGASDGYLIYRDTEPYFTPENETWSQWEPLAGPTLTQDDLGHLGDDLQNYYYVVTAVNNGADDMQLESTPSNRVGEFDFRLTPGNP